MKRKILGMMGKMEVLIRETGNIGIIELAGEIDIYNCGELKKLVDAFIERKIYNIIIDLGRVTYIDSSTIGVLLSELKRLKGYKGSLKLLKLKGAPRNVFQMAKLVDLFELYDDEKKAIADCTE
jgi:anti-anti-sigma factor